MYPFDSKTKGVRWSLLGPENSDDSIDDNTGSFSTPERNSAARVGSINKLRQALPWVLQGILICTYLTLGSRLVKPNVPEYFDGG